MEKLISSIALGRYVGCYIMNAKGRICRITQCDAHQTVGRELLTGKEIVGSTDRLSRRIVNGRLAWANPALN